MTTIDWLGLGLFFLCWLGYEPLLRLLAHRSGTLNTDMLTVRHAWMTAMTHREMRLLDSQLLGHSINSGSFFASSNLLLIAGVAGILFGGDQALQGFSAVGAEPVPVKLLEAKLGLVLLCLARGLLDRRDRHVSRKREVRLDVRNRDARRDGTLCRDGVALVAGLLDCGVAARLRSTQAVGTFAREAARARAARPSRPRTRSTRPFCSAMTAGSPRSAARRR